MDPATGLERVIAAWQLAGDAGDRRPGAADADLDRAEQALGRALPAPVRELYRWTDGGSFIEGNLSLHPLLPEAGDPDDLALSSASEALRRWEWPVPEDLVVF